MKKDYSELEGKEVDYTTPSGTAKLVVMACDFDIGLTLCAKKDIAYKVICLNGKYSPLSKDKDETTHKVTDILFYSIVHCIKNGRPIIFNKLLKIKTLIYYRNSGFEAQGVGSNGLQCAFNQ